MKTTFVLALAAAGFLAAVAPRTFAQIVEDEEEVVQPLAEAPKPAPAPPPPTPISPPPPAPAASGNVEFRHWHQGEPPLRLIRQEEGFCALTSIGGGFAGGAESVGVYVGKDGYWYLGGKSRQHGLDAQCVVVRSASVPPGKMDYAKRVKILAASYSFGSDYADVTARVKELLHAGKTFQANPDSLMVDPHPGWNKALVIFCKIKGKRAIFSVGEDEFISNELLVKKARPVTEKVSDRANLSQANPQTFAPDDAPDTSSPRSVLKPGAPVPLPLLTAVPVQTPPQGDQENRARTAVPGEERSEK